jgi:hypothetical protein
MAFLDNSGDIILDAVLTDTGRMRLAKGDGSFKIVKFALGDDEINYTRFDLNHPSGSAYADLELLQTPVLESFTNNTSLMNSRLVTIPRNNLLYLPVVKLNENFAGTARNTEISQFAIAVNDATVSTFASGSGVIDGTGAGNIDNNIRLDQGLDTSAISPTRALDPLLVETQYILEIDNRLGSIVSIPEKGNTVAPLSFIDDDQIATYVLSLDADPDFVDSITNTTTGGNQTIAGPRGTRLRFSVQASLELNASAFLFDQLGSETTLLGNNVDSIDTVIRVTGGTTGYRVDVPVRFIRNR